jgi:hypothetical protein
MENTPLHAQKVTILSRLIKESSLTLEEALLLLKGEEVEQEPPVFTPGTTTPYTVPYTQWPYGGGSGTITFSTTGNVGIATTNPTSSFSILSDSSAEADLNN